MLKRPATVLVPSGEPRLMLDRTMPVTTAATSPRIGPRRAPATIPTRTAAIRTHRNGIEMLGVTVTPGVPGLMFPVAGSQGNPIVVLNDGAAVQQKPPMLAVPSICIAPPGAVTVRLVSVKVLPSGAVTEREPDQVPVAVAMSTVNVTPANCEAPWISSHTKQTSHPFAARSRAGVVIGRLGFCASPAAFGVPPQLLERPTATPDGNGCWGSTGFCVEKPLKSTSLSVVACGRAPGATGIGAVSRRSKSFSMVLIAPPSFGPKAAARAAALTVTALPFRTRVPT